MGSVAYNHTYLFSKYQLLSPHQGVHGLLGPHDQDLGPGDGRDEERAGGQQVLLRPLLLSPQPHCDHGIRGPDD